MVNNSPVLFLDSGVGGISYCREFLERNPHEEVYYLADCKNFPYGPRSKEEISSILVNLTEKLIKIANPKIAVLACNTASISALADLRMEFPSLPIVGTVPAIKPAAETCGNGRIGVLGTERTIKDIRTLNLETGCCDIFGVAAPELVSFVEHRFDNADDNEKAKIVKKYIDIFRKENINSLVLGCTHFLFLLKEFRLEAGCQIKIFDSLEGITKRIEYLLDEYDGALRAEKTAHPSHKLILTGSSNSLWINRAQTLGFSYCFFDEL